MTVDQLLAACDIHQATAQKLAACKSFSCDDEDLDEFFAKDSLMYRKKLLGKTYLVCPKDDPTTIITAFSLSNDSIRITNRLTDEYKGQFLEDAELRDKTMKRSLVSLSDVSAQTSTLPDKAMLRLLWTSSRRFSVSITEQDAAS